MAARFYQSAGSGAFTYVAQENPTVGGYVTGWGHGDGLQ